jgi:2'-5' RNA ligase
MKRLFTALDLPDHLKPHIARISKGIAGARWERPELLHVTLSFFGDTDEATTTALRTALEAIKSDPIQLRLAGVGTFAKSTHKSPHVLWAGVTPCPRLATLKQEIDAAALTCGIPTEARKWNPHLTLARFKRPPGPDLKQWIEAHATLQIEPFDVREFHLYESQLTDSGAVHTILQSFKFA